MSLTTVYEPFSMAVRDRYNVEIFLVGDNGDRIVGIHIPTGDTIGAAKAFTVYGDVSEWRMELPPTDEISPAGSKWARDMTGSGVDPSDEPIYFEVPISIIPVKATDHLTDPPGEISDSALEVHAQDLSAHGHGITHEWEVHGWDPFTASVMTDAVAANGAPQTFALSVVNGRGVITGTQPAPAVDHRVAYLREGTGWLNSEITSLIYGPGPGIAWSGANAQQGHLHNAVEVSPGLWRAVAVWSSVAFNNGYEYLHAKLVEWTGGAFIGQGPSSLDGASDSPFFDRGVSVLGCHRVLFFTLAINNYLVQPKHMYGIDDPDVVTINSAHAGFSQTDVALNGTDPVSGMMQIVDPDGGDPLALTIDSGNIYPSGGSAHKRWVPYYLSTRVRMGETAAVEILRWRPEDPQPDWSSPRVRRGTLTFGEGVGGMPGIGLCGLWGAHFYGGSNSLFGNCSFRELIGT